MGREGAQNSETQREAVAARVEKMRKLYWEIGQPLTADLVEELSDCLAEALKINRQLDAQEVEKRQVQG